MKNRDEYLESIYTKRDAEIIKRKKRISVLTSVLCLGVCFASAFAFVPKYFGAETSISKSENTDKKIFAESDTSSEIPTVSDELFTLCLTYPAVYNESHIPVTDGIGNANMNDNEVMVTKKKDSTESDRKYQTEIAAESPAESTTRRMNFGYIGEPFDPEMIYSKSSTDDSLAFAPADPPEDFGTEVTEPCLEEPDSIEIKGTKTSTTAAKTKSPEEAVAEAKNVIPNEDISMIIDDKTHVTITRTANGKTTYTVYFYTNYKSFEIELDAVTLKIIECKEKNLISGKDKYYSPAYFPETTEALPAYIPE